ncbi:MAG: MATE family efflux transporter, partial [Microthrixaceae bacterium]
MATSPGAPGGRSLDRRIWSLAGPALLTLAAEPLYLLADTAVVGRLGADALAGLAVAATLLLLVTGVFIFLTFGTAATVARLLGAGRPVEAAQQSVQGLWLGLLCGVAAAAVLGVFGRPLVRVVGAEPSIADEALTYLRVSLAGLPAVCVAMAGTGALRGHLDTRTPLVVTVAANTANLALELVLVIGLGWGLAGSAAGTVVAQWGAAIAYTAVVLRRYGTGDVPRRPDPGRIQALAVVGRDLFVRTVALRVALTASTALAARRGPVALAGYQVAFQWWAFLAYLLDALEAAAQSLVGHALGAADRHGARQVAGRILAWSVGSGLVLGTATLLLREPVARLFTDDAAVIAVVVPSLVWVAVMQPVNGVAFALDGVLVGAGDQRFLARAMVGSLAVLLVAGGLTLAADTPLWGLWLAISVFMASRVL